MIVNCRVCGIEFKKTNVYKRCICDDCTKKEVDARLNDRYDSNKKDVTIKGLFDFFEYRCGQMSNDVIKRSMSRFNIDESQALEFYKKWRFNYVRNIKL